MFPPSCAICNGVLSPDESSPRLQVCDSCRQRYDWSDRPRCLRCGAFTTVSEPSGDGCSWCESLKLAFDQAICLGPYEEGLRELILRLKKWPRPALIQALVRLLLTQHAMRLSEQQKADVVVPVPHHWVARLSGRFDLVAVIAEELARELKIRFLPNALRRERVGPPQRGLPLRARFANASTLYSLGPHRFAELHVVAVDDVLTTGATLSTIATLLKEAGARCVTAVAIARAEGRRAGLELL